MAGETQGTALDAINEALGLSGGEGATETPEAEEPAGAEGDAGAGLEGEGEEGAGEGAEGDGAADGAGEGEEGTEGAGEDDAAAATGRERNPDGTFKKVDAEGKPIEGKPGEKKQPDALNDPIPKELKTETQDRIRTLIKTTKDVTAERDKFKTDFDYMIQGVQATGATPEQYGETLSFLALFNSSDPAQQEKALEVIEGVADRLATLLGKERTVGDPLASHADLKDAVAKGQVTAQYAKEIARTRNATAFRGEINTSVQQQQQQHQTAQQEMATARTDLTTLENSLRATDPAYEAKKAILVPILKPIFATIPPSQWKGAFEKAYKEAKVGAAPAAGVRKVGAGQQPMRAGKNPAGGQARAPASMLEAVSGALAGMK